MFYKWTRTEPRSERFLRRGLAADYVREAEQEERRLATDTHFAYERGELKVSIMIARIALVIVKGFAILVPKSNRASADWFLKRSPNEIRSGISFFNYLSTCLALVYYVKCISLSFLHARTMQRKFYICGYYFKITVIAIRNLKSLTFLFFQQETLYFSSSNPPRSIKCGSLAILP